MKPEYVNAFSLRKAAGPNGEILEVTLEMSHKYMDTAINLNPDGSMESVAAPASEPVASLVMNRQSAISLRNLLIQSLEEKPAQ